jgi:hypothetical protein
MEPIYIKLDDAGNAAMLRMILLAALEHVKDQKPLRDVCEDVIDQIDNQLGNEGE